MWGLKGKSEKLIKSNNENPFKNKNEKSTEEKNNGVIEAMCVMCFHAFVECQSETFGLVTISEEGMKTDGSFSYWLPMWNAARINFQFENDCIKMVVFTLANNDNVIDPHVMETLFNITDEKEGWNFTNTCNPQKISLESVKSLMSHNVNGLVDFKSDASQNTVDTMMKSARNLISLKRSLYTISQL